MKTRTITFMAMMLTLIVVLSILESFLPPFPFLPPGVKIGLSNIITMYALFFMGNRPALFLAFLKSCFVFATRGSISGMLSLSGGITSILILIILLALFKENISYTILSIFGAVFHNIGQLIAIWIILNNKYVFYYFPFLVIGGIIMGILTGILLKFIMPVFKNLLKDSGNMNY